MSSKEQDKIHVQMVTPWVIGEDSLNNQDGFKTDLKVAVDALVDFRDAHRKKTDAYMMGVWADKMRDLLAEADKSIRAWSEDATTSDPKTITRNLQAETRDANLSHWKP